MPIARHRPASTRRKICNFFAILLLLVLGGPGCDTGDGCPGREIEEEVLLEASGCLAPTPSEEGPPEPKIFPVLVPFELARLEVSLEVRGRELDLLVGTGNPPADYFSPGGGLGTRKILVGAESHEPLAARTWYVGLVGPYEFLDSCGEDQGPDWHLVVRRPEGLQGEPLLDEEGEVAGCMPWDCDRRRYRIDVPEDASTLEVVLETTDGDADLFVGPEDRPEAFTSLNPGTGFDVVFLDAHACAPFRGGTVMVTLESWQGPSTYRLQAAYVPGAPVVPEPSP